MRSSNFKYTIYRITANRREEANFTKKLVLSPMDSETVIMDANKSMIGYMTLFISRLQTLLISNQNQKPTTMVADLSLEKGFFFALYILPITAKCFVKSLRTSRNY